MTTTTIDLAAYRSQRISTRVAAELLPQGRAIHPSLLSCPTCEAHDVTVLVRDGQQVAVECNTCGVVRAIGADGQRVPIDTTQPTLTLLAAGAGSDG